MKEKTSIEALQEIDALFRSKEYAQAETLAEKSIHRFPLEADEFAYLRMCAAVRLGRIPQALQWLKEVLDAGGWYSEFFLRKSPSFEPLQELPEFERLVEVSLGQREADLKREPKHYTLAPERGDPPWPLFLALHGNTHSAVWESRYWRSLASRGWLLAMAESSQGHWKGGYIWDDGELAQRDLEGCFRSLPSRYPMDPGRVLLGGFSYGGQRAIEHALKGTVGALGFLVFCPYLPEMDGWSALLDRGFPPSLRGYFITTEQDEDRAHSLALASLLQARGIACQVEDLPGEGHWFPVDFDSNLARGLGFLLDRAG
jgi:dienelactone hydrolase